MGVPVPLQNRDAIKGRWIKLGPEWVRLKDITQVTVTGTGRNRKLKVKHKKGKEHEFSSDLLDEVKAILDVEAGKE